MRLEQLLGNQYQGQLIHSSMKELDIEAISSDSRQVKKNSLFIAAKGLNTSGVNYIPEAIQKGARVIATSEQVEWPWATKDICLLRIDDPHDFLREVARRFYGNPSQEIRTIAVTGTNGKTTVSYLLESILESAGKRSAVMGTINYRMGKKVFASVNTTPGLLENQFFLSQLVVEKFDYCVMEVSSHALAQGRVDLIDFVTAIFTNLTSDHLDYHQSRENYFQAKSKLFVDLAPSASAVINIDDPFGQRLLSMTKAKCITYGIKGAADVKAKDSHGSLEGTKFKFVSAQEEIPIETSLVGIYNVYNILAVIAACLKEGINIDTIREGIRRLKGVPGRLERLDYGQNFSVFIDYAHTQDALENVLRALREVSRSKIILVFGCGGDRDRTKRPLMGRTASQWADECIVTSDNPRQEDPRTILDEIIPGFKRDNYKVILDRREAIEYALSAAKEGDIILIAGKGHEDYQILKDEKIPFNEKDIVKEYFQCLR